MMRYINEYPFFMMNIIVIYLDLFMNSSNSIMDYIWYFIKKENILKMINKTKF